MATTHQIDFTQVANLFDEIERKVAVLPAHVQRDGKDVAIVLSAQQYVSLAARGASEADPEIMALHEKSVKQRRSVYEAFWPATSAITLKTTRWLTFCYLERNRGSSLLTQLRRA